MKKIIGYPFVLLRRLYDWTAAWSHKKSSNYAMFIISFMESSFFPIPPDVILIPLVATNPKSWWKKAFICTAGSVCGAFLGYAIGYLFYETIGIAIINFYNLADKMASVENLYKNHAFVSIFLSGFTPLPYKLFTLSAGFFKIPLLTLLFASILGRGGRFFIVAGALRIFGRKIQYVIEKYFNILSIIFLLLLISGFIVVRHLL